MILSTRGWEPIYGVDLIARAFVTAARQCPELKLIMLGNGSLAPMLHRIFAKGNVEEQVMFPGQVKYSELPRYYQMADLYVSASHSDGSSISLLEAMACGRPVLVSDIPGNREWVTPYAPPHLNSALLSLRPWKRAMLAGFSRMAMPMRWRRLFCTPSSSAVVWRRWAAGRVRWLNNGQIGTRIFRIYSRPTILPCPGLAKCRSSSFASSVLGPHDFQLRTRQIVVQDDARNIPLIA